MQKSREENPLSNVRNIIAIAAGKGGVGKSTTTVNLARSLQKKGYQIGILDADVYGPSLAMMLGIDQPPQEKEKKMVPAYANGIAYISMAFFENSFKSSVLRAPLANQVIEEFIHKVDWGDLDFLLVDFPPGTGDVQITLMQQISFTLGIAVTTPQQVALLDVKKAMDMFLRMNIEILGVIQNMSYFIQGGEKIYPFGEGLTEAFAKKFGVNFLGEIPIDPLISFASDHSLSLFDTDSVSKKYYLDLADLVIDYVSNPNKKYFFDVEWHLNRKAFVLTFSDGVSIVARAAKVQKSCSCIRCQGSAPKVEEEVSILQINPVGNYGVKFDFSHGCSRGIYTFEKLKKL
jgi:ATP-binding protein involved in chromosome partitioning